jgi:hypothetical protein
MAARLAPAGLPAGRLASEGTDWRKDNTSGRILQRDPQIAGLDIGSANASR